MRTALKAVATGGALALALTLPASADPSRNLDESVAGLAAAIGAGDAAATAAHYAEDAILLPPGSPRIDGAEALKVLHSGQLCRTECRRFNDLRAGDLASQDIRLELHEKIILAGASVNFERAYILL